ncbi:MAG: hypothetical protein KBS68_01485 [Clostridiales bacterium]|nr:hypothetical protein [Candidatus Crickella merdequi]
MTYLGELALPENAVMMEELEMRYITGGASWSKVITTQNKKYTYKYRVTVSNVKQATVALLAGGAATASLVSSLAVLAGSCGTAAISAAAQAISSIAGIGYSAQQLKKLITVTRVG